MVDNVVILGMEPIIKRDLDKHKIILDRTVLELIAFKSAVQQEIQKKKYYLSLIGTGKYNDVSLKRSIDDINVNIRHMEDKTKLANDKIEHNKLIVDTLSKQLVDYRKKIDGYVKYKSDLQERNN